MLDKVSSFVMIGLLVLVPALGCKSTKPKPPVYPPVNFTPTPTSGLAPAVADQWVCPMHPNFRLPQPGKCSMCGMDLVHSSELSGAEAPSSGSGNSHSSGSGHSSSSGSGHGCCG